MVFVFAALYLVYAHRQQWNKMQQLDEELEQDISRLMGKLAEVPNIQKTTAVLVDEHQIKKQSQTGGYSFRWIYLDQLLGLWTVICVYGRCFNEINFKLFQANPRESPQSAVTCTQNGATDRNFVVWVVN